MLPSSLAAEACLPLPSRRDGLVVCKVEIVEYLGALVLVEDHEPQDDEVRRIAYRASELRVANAVCQRLTDEVDILPGAPFLILAPQVSRKSAIVQLVLHKCVRKYLALTA